MRDKDTQKKIALVKKIFKTNGILINDRTASLLLFKVNGAVFGNNINPNFKVKKQKNLGGIL